MLRIVFPTAISAAISTTNVGAVASTDVCISIKVIIVVYGDVVISAPAAAPTPAAAPRRSHRNSNPKGNGHPGGVITGRGVSNGWIRIRGRPVNDCWVITRHVDDLRAGLFDDDYLFRFHNLGLYLLLFVAL